LEQADCDVINWSLRNCLLGERGEDLVEIVVAQIAKAHGGLSWQLGFSIVEELEVGPPASKADVLDFLGVFASVPCTRNPLEENVEYAEDALGLHNVERDILRLVLRCQRLDQLAELSDLVHKRLDSVSWAIAALIGCRAREAHLGFAPTGKLIRSGLLCVNPEAQELLGPSGYFSIPYPVKVAMLRPYKDKTEWLEGLVGLSAKSSLERADFQHVEQQFDQLGHLISAESKSTPASLNILVYGPAGIGKTEFVKAAAAAFGHEVWSVGETDEFGNMPSRGERLASLRRAQSLLKLRERSVVLFEVAEDLFNRNDLRGRGDGCSISFLANVLDQVACPTIWTAERLDCFDPSFVSRMTLVVELKVPGPQDRAAMLGRILQRAAIHAEEPAIRAIANRWASSPAQMKSAARVAAAGQDCGELKQVDAALASSMRTLGKGPDPVERRSKFEVGLIACDIDIVQLTETLATPGASRDWSICIDGLPGSGKSQFARYLAERIGIGVLQKRPSDLLSKYIGESERRIADAFAEAADQGALLLFDEVDAVLAPRDGGRADWVVSQVSEMLIWMDTHNSPFVCTTNEVARIDPAAMRRFSLKLTFRELDEARAAELFERYFGVRANGRMPQGLCPGDFNAVSRRCQLTGRAEERRLIEWLEGEVMARGATRALGFHPPSRSRPVTLVA
jgi:transitional endoplasmic reticulum ATPase